MPDSFNVPADIVNPALPLITPEISPVELLIDRAPDAGNTTLPEPYKAFRVSPIVLLISNVPLLLIPEVAYV